MIELANFRGINCMLNGCSTGIQPLFFTLWTMSNGEPCNGCGWASECTVNRFNKKPLTARAKVVSAEITNAELAKKLGVTKRQVSKMRSEGTLEGVLKQLSEKSGETEHSTCCEDFECIHVKV